MFVEGKTEETYVKHWSRRHRDRVLVNVDPFRSAPLQLVERAVAEQRKERQEHRRNAGGAHDQIWCVFDRDEHPHFDEACELAKAHDIGLAISNPCIEVWFLLHFQSQTAAIEGGRLQRQVEHLLGSKIPSPTALDQLVDHYGEAKRRARSLDRKHEGDGSRADSNTSSGMWRLVEEIVTA